MRGAAACGGVNGESGAGDVAVADGVGDGHGGVEGIEEVGEQSEECCRCRSVLARGEVGQPRGVQDVVLDGWLRDDVWRLGLGRH